VTLEERLDRQLGEFEANRPVVVFSSTASMHSHFREKTGNHLLNLCDYFQDISSSRDVLIPSFPKGAVENFIDLDSRQSANGMLSEAFRERFAHNRTRSAFFPFTVVGPSSESLFRLEPRHAWGAGSVYEWLESNDAVIVTIGLPIYVCSFQHRAEFLEKDKVHYREFITMEGTLNVRSTNFAFRETLFARRAGVNVDFRPITPFLSEVGQIVEKFDNITISSVSSRRKLNLVREMIRADPGAFVKGEK